MAYTFNGSNQYMTVPFTVSSYPLTFFARANPVSFAGGPCAISLDNSGNAPNSIGIYYSPATGSARAGIEPAGLYVNTTSTATLSAFSSLAGIFTSSQVSIFLNGADKVTASHSSGFPSVDRIGLGSSRYSGVQYNYLNGSIAEVAIWNAALTDAEIASLAAGFTPDQVRPQSLSLYAPLIRNLADLRLGRTITNVGGAIVSTHPRIIQ